MIEVLNALSERAQLASERHLQFVQALFGLRNNAMHAHDGLSPGSITDVKDEMEGAAWRYINHESDLVAAYVPAATREAHRDALRHLGLSDRGGDAEAISEAFAQRETQTREYLNAEIVSQASRDVNQILRDYRRGAIRLDLLKRNGQPWIDARIKVATDMSARPSRTWFIDRAGRKHPSQRFIRQTWRAAFRDHYMGVYLDTLMTFGQGRAVIWHPDPQHNAYGLEVDLFELETDFERLELDGVFHPNANALPLAAPHFERIAA